MKRHGIKKVEASILVVDRNVNFRDDYDVPSMMEEIRQAGRVLEPIWVRKEDNVVLKGNRRVTAVQELLRDKALPSDLKEAIAQLDTIYVEGLSDKELTELVLDHGSQKPLSRSETVKAIWRLQKQMYSEREIIILMYHQLSRFTGQTRKAYEAQQLPPGNGREEFLKKWLHGTVGNYLMAAGQMGDRVKEQLILTETGLDRALSKEETDKVEFKVTRDRVNKLGTAKKEDKESQSGWDNNTGGKAFNALIEKFKAEDTGAPTEKSSRPTPKQMADVAETMKSRLSVAYKHCSGNLSDGEKGQIDALDTEMYRTERISAIARNNLDRIEKEEIRELVRFFVSGTEAEFEQYIKRFVKETA